jgi:hypothetical protein
MPLTIPEIIQLRLNNQQLVNTNLATPEEVIHWLVAMQAQEYAMAKWAIGLRLPKSSEADVEKAFNNGDILRTHLMRPTWHFVSPEDIRWLIKLTAPRVRAISAYMNRKLELDAKLLKRCFKIIIDALEGGHHLTRADLQSALSNKKIIADGHRMAHIMMEAELEQLICSGSRKGKQFTYALLDERVPLVKEISGKEALSKLMQRYFTSRGPATLQDFVYWSGLTMKDAVAGASTLNSRFTREKFGKQEFIFIPPSSKIKMKPVTFLMPDYDEYGISYKDRTAIFPVNKLKGIKASIVFNRMVVIDGHIEGTWQRMLTKNSAEIKIVPFRPFSKIEQEKVAKGIKRYQAFLK